MPLEKMSNWKKVAILLLIVIVLIPVISLTEGVCELYTNWATAHQESGLGRWLLYRVGGIHDLMGRQDLAADIYGKFYEAYKLPLEDLPEEDSRVAEARFQQALAYYDRDRLKQEELIKAHKYFHYYLIKYESSGTISDERRESAIRYREECESKAREYALPLLAWRDEYPIEYTQYYEP